MEISRTKSVAINITVSMIIQIILAAINLVTRKLVIDNVGIEIFGVEGLFTSLMTMIYTIELGVASASSYYYALGISKNDDEDIYNTYISFKQLYKFISLFIIIIDIIILFNLNNIITTSVVDYRTLQCIFVITCISRLVTFYKNPYELLIVYFQKQYIAQFIYLITGIIFSVLKLILVYIFKNYIVYLLVTLSESIVALFLIAFRSNKLINKLEICHDKIKTRNKQIVNYGIKIFLNGYMSTLFISKDNLIISYILGNKGILEIGKISNYNVIFFTISSFSNSIMASLRASVVNYINDDSVNSNENVYSIMNVILFATFCICSFCFIGLYGMSTPFISLLYGIEYSINNIYVLIFSINIVFELLIVSLQFYITGKGIINFENKYLVLSVFVSIVFSFGFTQLFGPVGTYLGTSIGYLIRLLFLTYIMSKDLNYKFQKLFFKIIKYLFVIVMSSLILNLFIIEFPNGLVDFMYNILICGITFIISIVIFVKSDEFKFLIKLVIKK